MPARLLREPLIQFCVLGVALFLGLRAAGVESTRETAPGSAARKNDATIVVTEARINGLRETFTRTWQRPPSEEELSRLVREYVREEASYREALALGLDRDDAIIRRRLQQKLEFVSQNLAEQVEPTDADLRAYLQAHPESFRNEATLSFEQVYLDPEKHGASLDADTAALLAELGRRGDEDVDVMQLGDPTILERQLSDASIEEIANLFGADFAAGVAALPTGQWRGPVRSAYGVHLVRVSARAPARLPALEEIRDAVRREWTNSRDSAARENLYQTLLQRYDVEIEPAGGTDPTVAQAADLR